MKAPIWAQIVFGLIATVGVVLIAILLGRPKLAAIAPAVFIISALLIRYLWPKDETAD